MLNEGGVFARHLVKLSTIKWFLKDANLRVLAELSSVWCFIKQDMTGANVLSPVKVSSSLLGNTRFHTKQIW